MQQYSEQTVSLTRKQWVLLWSLPVTFFLIVGIYCGRNALAARRAAAIAAAQALAQSQAAAVQRLMTVFPSPPRKEVGSKMASYIVSGAGATSFNGTYVENGTYGGKPSYELDSSHWLYYDSGTWYLNVAPGEIAPAYYSVGETPDGVWTVQAESAPAPTVTLVAADTTKPTIDSASIDAAGTTLTINWVEAGTPPIVGTTGLSLTGLTPSVTLSSISNSDTTTTATISRAVYSSEVPELAYTPGDFADSATPANTVAAFSGMSVTNNSTQRMPSQPIYNAVTVTGEEVSVDRGAATSKGYVAILHVAPDVAGTTPTLDVIIEHSADTGPDSGKTWETLCTFTQVTSGPSVQRLVSADSTTTIKRFVRASHTLGGSTPKFAYLLALGTRV